MQRLLQAVLLGDVHADQFDAAARAVAGHEVRFVAHPAHFLVRPQDAVDKGGAPFGDHAARLGQHMPAVGPVHALEPEIGVSVKSVAGMAIHPLHHRTDIDHRPVAHVERPQDFVDRGDQVGQWRVAARGGRVAAGRRCRAGGRGAPQRVDLAMVGQLLEGVDAGQLQQVFLLPETLEGVRDGAADALGHVGQLGFALARQGAEEFQHPQAVALAVGAQQRDGKGVAGAQAAFDGAGAAQEALVCRDVLHPRGPPAGPHLSDQAFAGAHAHRFAVGSEGGQLGVRHVPVMTAHQGGRVPGLRVDGPQRAPFPAQVLAHEGDQVDQGSVQGPGADQDAGRFDTEALAQGCVLGGGDVEQHARAQAGPIGRHRWHAQAQPAQARQGMDQPEFAIGALAGALRQVGHQRQHVIRHHMHQRVLEGAIEAGFDFEQMRGGGRQRHPGAGWVEPPAAVSGKLFQVAGPRRGRQGRLQGGRRGRRAGCQGRRGAGVG